MAEKSTHDSFSKDFIYKIDNYQNEIKEILKKQMILENSLLDFSTDVKCFQILIHQRNSLKQNENYSV